MKCPHRNQPGFLHDTRNRCLPCTRAYVHNRYRANLGKLRAQARARYYRNRAVVREYARKQYLKNKVRPGWVAHRRAYDTATRARDRQLALDEFTRRARLGLPPFQLDYACLDLPEAVRQPEVTTNTPPVA